MYIKYLQIALNYRTHTRCCDSHALQYALPTASREWLGKGQALQMQMQVGLGMGMCTGQMGRSEATATATAIVVCSTYNLSGWRRDLPCPAPATPSQAPSLCPKPPPVLSPVKSRPAELAGSVEEAKRVNLCLSLAVSTSICVSPTLSVCVSLSIFAYCPTLHFAVNLAHGVQICFDLLRVPAAVATWIPMDDTSHCTRGRHSGYRYKKVMARYWFIILMKIKNRRVEDKELFGRIRISKYKDRDQ